jgi:AcrR family transcriptional regulator
MRLTTRSPGSRRAAATREHLLEVAATAFAEHGYAATSMSDLVQRAGVTRGAFYFHFDSKEALALATFRRKQQEFIRRVTEGLTGTRAESAVDQLVAGLRLRSRLMRNDPAFNCLRRLCTELRSDPRLAPQVSTFHAEPVALLTAVIQAAQTQGDIRRDVPPERLARLMFTALVGIDEFGGPTDGGRMTEDLLLLVMPGLQPD